MSSTPPADRAEVPAVLVLVTGLQGTGKSTIAGSVADALHAPVLAWDWFMGALTRFDDVQETFRAMGKDRYRDVGWALLFQVARAQLVRGMPVVIDGLARAGEVHAARELAAEVGARSFVVLTSCGDVELQRARVVGRDRAIPGWHELTWDDVERTRSRWTPLPDVDIELDETASVAEHTATVVRRLGA